MLETLAIVTLAAYLAASVTAFKGTATYRGRSSGRVTAQPFSATDVDAAKVVFDLTGLTYFSMAEPFDLIDVDTALAAVDVIDALDLVKDGQITIGRIQLAQTFVAIQKPHMSPVGFSANSLSQLVQHDNA